MTGARLANQESCEYSEYPWTLTQAASQHGKRKSQIGLVKYNLMLEHEL